MNVKTDTKERFTVIMPEERVLSAILTEELGKYLLTYLQKDIPHVILKMNDIEEVENAAATRIASLQQEFYEHNASFVICGMQEAVEDQFEKLELLDVMNVTPTESEA